MKFRREIRIYPAYDKRDPDPKKDYGIHNAVMYFYLHGEKGVIQLQVSTAWHLPHVQSELDMKPSHRAWGTDLGYHSPVPMYEGQSLLSENCPILGGGKCYYDGSTLNAEPVFELLVREGDEAVWKRLEEEYELRFVTEQA